MTVEDRSDTDTVSVGTPPKRDAKKVGEYAEARLDKFSKWCKLYKKLYFIGESLVIVSGALTVVFAGLSDSKVPATLLAGLTVLVTGLNKLVAARDRWVAYGTARHVLRKGLKDYETIDGEPSLEQRDQLQKCVEAADDAQYAAWLLVRNPEGD